MFGWFKKKQPPLQPEGKWVVAIEGDRISVRDDSGQLKSVAKSDLSGVAIETNDSGPWGADVWWMLFDATDQMACASLREPQVRTLQSTGWRHCHRSITAK